jgi:hypothetical protein
VLDVQLWGALKMSRIFSTLIPVTRRIRFRRIRSPPQAEDGGSAIKMRHSLVILDILIAGIAVSS